MAIHLIMGGGDERAGHDVAGRWGKHLKVALCYPVSHQWQLHTVLVAIQQRTRGFDDLCRASVLQLQRVQWGAFTSLPGTRRP